MSTLRLKSNLHYALNIDFITNTEVSLRDGVCGVVEWVEGKRERSTARVLCHVGSHSRDISEETVDCS